MTDRLSSYSLVEGYTPRYLSLILAWLNAGKSHKTNLKDYKKSEFRKVKSIAHKLPLLTKNN